MSHTPWLGMACAFVCNITITYWTIGHPTIEMYKWIDKLIVVTRLSPWTESLGHHTVQVDNC